MTTNHRPTLESKRGKANAITDSIAHSRSLPSQTTLKYRRDAGTVVDPARAKRGVDELKRELLISEGKLAESDHKRPRIRSANDSEDESDSSDDDEETLLEELRRVKEQIANDKAHASGEDETGGGPAGASGSGAQSASEDEDASESGSDDDSEDETQLLLAELAKIKQERQEEKERKEKEEAEQKAKTSNPLVSLDNSEAPVKKSWRDSTAFNNKPKPKPKGKSNNENFTNDTLRSDFHQKFLSKYIR